MTATIAFKITPNWKAIPCPVHGCRAYQWGDVRVFVGIEAGKWHLSISTPYRYPTWDEIKAARYDFMPDQITVGMILPPKTEYVNVHNYCFHLHEIEGDSK
jgi:hypothetical protein